MRSVTKLQVFAEGTARLVALALLAWSLWVVAGEGASGLPAVNVTSTLRDGDVGALVRGGPSALTVRMGHTPSSGLRDVVRALRINGSTVQWERDSVAAFALSAEPIAGPGAQSRIVAFGEIADPVVLLDAGGVLDSASSEDGRSYSLTGPVRGTVRARGRLAGAQIAAAPAGNPKPVLVLGRVGWEAKFVVAALEEAGWQVMSELQVTPARPAEGTSPVVVRNVPGIAASLDTASLGTVIVLDGSAFSYGRRIAAFAGAGGGVVLGIDAVRDIPLLSALSPGRPGSERIAQVGALSSRPARDGLSGIALQGSSDAVAVEFNRGDLMLAARRVGLGRVVTMGYRDTWRWRMEGSDGGVEEHRKWWSDLVSLVSIVPSSPAPSEAISHDPAPLATWVRTFGPPIRSAAPALPQGLSVPWLVISAAVLLLAEWSSRRLRGVR